MKPNPAERSAYDQVKSLHQNSDIDESPIAQHHTLGSLPSQASPGDHVHDGTSSRKLDLKNLQGVSIVYTPVATAAGTAPAGFAVSGSYTRFGNLCFFQAKIDFADATNFGTGQYKITLPFATEEAIQFRSGCLHDISASRQYMISGHAAKDSADLLLFTTNLDSNQIFDSVFTYQYPVTVATADNFHIAGTYEIQQ